MNAPDSRTEGGGWSKGRLIYLGVGILCCLVGIVLILTGL